MHRIISRGRLVTLPSVRRVIALRLFLSRCLHASNKFSRKQYTGCWVFEGRPSGRADCHLEQHQSPLPPEELALGHNDVSWYLLPLLSSCVLSALSPSCSSSYRRKLKLPDRSFPERAVLVQNPCRFRQLSLHLAHTKILSGDSFDSWMVRLLRSFPVSRASSERQLDALFRCDQGRAHLQNRTEHFRRHLLFQNTTFSSWDSISNRVMP